MALNFELVVSDQLFSVVLAAYKWFKISAPGVQWQQISTELDSLGQDKGFKTIFKVIGPEKKNIIGDTFFDFTTQKSLTANIFKSGPMPTPWKFLDSFSVIPSC